MFDAHTITRPFSYVLVFASFAPVTLSKFFIFLFSSQPQDMHIISTDEKQVFAAVQEWNQNNTYSLYISDSPGVYFILSLENLRTNRGPAGNLLVDFYKVCCQFFSRTLLSMPHLDIVCDYNNRGSI